MKATMREADGVVVTVGEAVHTWKGVTVCTKVCTVDGESRLPFSHWTDSQDRSRLRAGGAHREGGACTGGAHLGAHLEWDLKGGGAHLKHLKEKRFRGLEGLTPGQGAKKEAERVSLFSGVTGVHGSQSGRRKKDRRVSARPLVSTESVGVHEVCTV